MFSKMARGTSLQALLLVVSVCTARAAIHATGSYKGMEDLKKKSSERPEARSMLGHMGHDDDDDHHEEMEMEDPSPKYFKMSPPVMDADYSAGAVWGDPDNISCETVASLGLCATSPYSAICPKSCMEPGSMPEDYCTGDKDALFREYIQLLVPATNFSEVYPEGVTCPDVAPGGKLDDVITYFNMAQNFACADPAIALLCADTCKTNCWSFPPLKTTKVYLPGCSDSTHEKPGMLISKDAQRMMYKTVSDTSREKQCPP